MAKSSLHQCPPARVEQLFANWPESLSAKGMQMQSLNGRNRRVRKTRKTKGTHASREVRMMMIWEEVVTMQMHKQAD